MTGSRLLVGLASVFAGVAAVMLVVASVYRTPVPLAIAAPFGLTGYLLWYHGTGKLEERMRQRARHRRARRQRHANAGRHARDRQRSRRSARAGSRRPPSPSSGPSRREAYRVLDLDPGADEGQIKRAYRAKVKATHPDRGGDEEAFKRVNDAYERLTG